MTENEPKPKFICDGNAGKLARWLRALGYDATFAHPIDDRELVARALREGRVLLTRDAGILARRVVITGGVRAILLTSDRVEEQLRQVAGLLRLDTRTHRFTRCLECNERLTPCSAEEASPLVPAYIASSHRQFSRCPACRRVYWRGSHWERINRILNAIRECS